MYYILNIDTREVVEHFIVINDFILNMVYDHYIDTFDGYTLSSLMERLESLNKIGFCILSSKWLFVNMDFDLKSIISTKGINNIKKYNRSLNIKDILK